MFEPSLKSKESKVDWAMWLGIFGLMVVGFMFIYSARAAHQVMTPWERYQESSFLKFFLWLLKQEYFKQVVAYGLGLGAVAVMCLRDYRRLARWSLVFYWLSIVLLVLVLIPGIGTTHGWGASRWIDLGPVQFQPSEFGKLALLVALANFLSRPAEELKLPGVFLKAVGMAALPFFLILVEPDLGSAMVVLPMVAALLYTAGLPGKYFKWAFVGAGTVMALVIVDVIYAPPQWRLPLKEYQRDRLLVYFGQDFAPRNATAAEREAARQRQRDKNQNIDQALIAVGSGGFTGKGWGKGTQNALGFLPGKVAHNDFIFSIIAEEKGFLGSVAVLALYTVVLFCGIRIAGQARDRLGKLLAVGVVTMLFSHVFINIGMNIRLMPVTGIPLPLLSYGGTSVLCTLITIGILQNISIYRRAY